MGYNQFTKCVHPEDWVDLSVRHARGLGFWITILVTSIMGAIAAGTVFGAPGFIAGILVCLAIVTSIIVLVRWELFGKLVCLDDTPICAILGMVYDVEPPNPGPSHGDDDTNMNLILQPDLHPSKEDLDSKIDKQVFRNNVQGYLITENPRATHGYTQEGKHLKALHCEFEGENYRRLLDSLYALETLLIAALTIAIVLAVLNLSLFLPFLLAIVALLLAGLETFQRILRPTTPPPDPYTVGIDKGDFVLMRGKWVYDSLHAGWNEIHPVQHCQLVASPKIPDGHGPKDFRQIVMFDPVTNTAFNLDSDQNIQRYLNIACLCFQNADDAQEGGNRDNPEHGWSIHPSVDGCKPPIIIE